MTGRGPIQRGSDALTNMPDAVRRMFDFDGHPERNEMGER